MAEHSRLMPAQQAILNNDNLEWASGSGELVVGRSKIRK